MRNAVLNVAAGTLFIGFTFVVAPSAQAQFTGQYTNPHTGRTFNNSVSSLLDTAILNMGRQMLMESSMMSASTANRLLAEQKRRGAQVIKSGRANTRFTPRSPFPTEWWLKRVPADQRKQWAEEAALQKTIWDQYAQDCGANKNDMADVLALTFVMGWEAQTGGQRATPAQFRGIAKDFRQMMLKDTFFQGMSLGERQVYTEGHLLNASDTVRLLREARRTRDDVTLMTAKVKGRTVTDAWLPTGYTHYVAVASGFQHSK